MESQVRATPGQSDASTLTAPVGSRFLAESVLSGRVCRACAYACAMPSQISEAQSQILHEQIVPDFLAMLDDAPALEDPAEVERLAANMLVPLEQPEIPPEVGFAVVEGIAARRDADAAGVLAALAALAAEPLAGQARADAQRLAREGITSPATARVGTLAVQEAVRIQSVSAELLLALLARPGSEQVQVAVLGIEHEDTGGALVDWALTPPAPVAEARELLAGADGTVTQPIAADELAERVNTAARRAIDAEIALGPDAGPALPVVSRALTGDPSGLWRSSLLAPWEQDDPELIVDAAADEEGFHRLMDQLLDELEQHARTTYPPDSVVWEHGDFVASTMLQWKGDYDDGRLGRWTHADLVEYMLDYFPRKVSVDEETLAAVPECIRAFLGFLAARGSLSGEPLEQLEQACEKLREEFLDSARDSSQWGPAKSMVMQMQAEGIDPSAPGALDAWVEGFNAGPRAQRDAIIGPAADRMVRAAGLPSGAGPRAAKQKTQRRKAQRAARKRNRRG
jgi:hypothetical protein